MQAGLSRQSWWEQRKRCQAAALLGSSPFSSHSKHRVTVHTLCIQVGTAATGTPHWKGPAARLRWANGPSEISSAQ